MWPDQHHTGCPKPETRLGRGERVSAVLLLCVFSNPTVSSFHHAFMSLHTVMASGTLTGVMLDG